MEPTLPMKSGKKEKNLEIFISTVGPRALAKAKKSELGACPDTMNQNLPPFRWIWRQLISRDKQHLGRDYFFCAKQKEKDCRITGTN